jgi:hypothetical protein
VQSRGELPAARAGAAVHAEQMMTAAADALLASTAG